MSIQSVQERNFTSGSSRQDSARTPTKLQPFRALTSLFAVVCLHSVAVLNFGFAIIGYLYLHHHLKGGERWGEQVAMNEAEVVERVKRRALVHEPMRDKQFIASRDIPWSGIEADEIVDLLHKCIRSILPVLHPAQHLRVDRIVWSVMTKCALLGGAR
ncbi:hypothetical protein [Collimonas fungivorans]|uniref:hypothetical protein n=1 Tax=Collimonas fungivorans TaxID=158899 RepID=UPI0007784C12|nr:hypothetical protein [Collimonas fungivorans]